MTLGEKLKQLRNDKQLSQPELAEKIGIEQSYLSKLENDKSIPSNDIFRRLLKALDINVLNFISQFDAHYVRTVLCQITDVESHYHEEQSKKQSVSRKLLIVSSVLIVIATTLFYTGITSILFPETIYSYESKGIIFDGEPVDLYEGGLHRSTPDSSEFRKKKDELERRYNPHRLNTSENRGNAFTIAVVGGRRTYEIKADIDVERIGNAILQILGILLFSGGVMGFVYEFRMSKYGSSITQ